jgi:hypothetical protein
VPCRPVSAHSGNDRMTRIHARLPAVSLWGRCPLARHNCFLPKTTRFRAEGARIPTNLTTFRFATNAIGARLRSGARAVGRPAGAAGNQRIPAGQGTKETSRLTFLETNATAPAHTVPPAPVLTGAGFSILRACLWRSRIPGPRRDGCRRRLPTAEHRLAAELRFDEKLVFGDDPHDRILYLVHQGLLAPIAELERNPRPLAGIVFSAGAATPSATRPASASDADTGRGTQDARAPCDTCDRAPPPADVYQPERRTSKRRTAADGTRPLDISLTRCGPAVAAVKKTGHEISRVEIGKDGKITVVIATEGRPTDATTAPEVNEWNEP